MSFMFDKLKDAVKDAQSSVQDAVSKAKTSSAKTAGGEPETSAPKTGKHTHLHMHAAEECSDGDSHHLHRFQSFAPQRQANDAKWYVDACGYMWAVSEALEKAKHEIWILDWWLSPELYLRRPPAKNEKYRVDKLLFAAAQRGVQVNVLIYKEVTQALTLSSSHTKHWLEDNDSTGNIKVLRHPDHLPDRQTLASSIWSSIKESGMSASKLASLPGDAVKGIYGMSEDSILFWAHHEKLCLVDGHVAFMGGLDLCYGRWDTNQHSIADAHPGDLDAVVFPGQDYNNARIMDFNDVQHWENNKLDRKHNSRMGWTDVSISLIGPVVEDLRAHFAQRWNFIYFEKYDVRDDKRYWPLTFQPSRVGIIGHPYQDADNDGEPDGEGELEGQFADFKNHVDGQVEKGRNKLEEIRKRLKQGASASDEGKKLFEEGREKLKHEIHRGKKGSDLPAHPSATPQGRINCQIMRSCTQWSHGVPLEHSIANAYIDTIKRSEHFVYIENQFFITATGDKQKPVENRIGAAIVERILRAAKNKEDYHMIIAIPGMPGFAGDIKSDDALGTRAIMEFQYNSINRYKGESILEKISAAGVDPMEYIRFYNLRNYDRINSSKAMKDVEAKAGVEYDDARRGYDQKFSQAVDSEHYGAGHKNPSKNQDAYKKYQEAAKEIHGQDGKKNWDSVASCYMLNGEDIRNVPWDGDAQSEIDAFVSEELYIHTKMLIADDRKVICGSANLNDRSQLGSHDSEIAILIEDQEEVDSFMAGKPWQASKFATSLRRQIFRKHLGLLPPQDPSTPDTNYLPVGQEGSNKYDWGSAEDKAVEDPLSPAFMNLWKTTAHDNTMAFRKVFHAIPDDTVLNWKQYDEFYDQYFKPQEANKQAKGQSQEVSAFVKVGHVVPGEFKGEEGLKELKECLSKVKGTLVEMPLLFLKDEDIAKEGLGLNSLTEVVYT